MIFHLLCFLWTTQAAYVGFSYTAPYQEVLETSITLNLNVDSSLYDFVYGIISGTQITSPSTADIKNGAGNIDANCSVGFNGAIIGASPFPKTFDCSATMPHGQYYYIYLAFQVKGTTTLETGDPSTTNPSLFPIKLFSTPRLNLASSISDLAVKIDSATSLTVSWTNPAEIANTPVSFADVTIQLFKSTADTSAYHTVPKFGALGSTQNKTLTVAGINNALFANSGTQPIYLFVFIFQDLDSIGPYNFPPSASTSKLYLVWKPGTPAWVGLQVPASASSVQLTWSAPTFTGGAGVNIKEYRIQHSRYANFSDNIAARVVSNTTLSHNITGLTPNGVDWYFRIRAVNSLPSDRINPQVSEVGDWSTVEVVALLFRPNPPTAVTLSDSGPTSMTLAWVAPAEVGGTPITGYQIYFAANSTAFSSSIPSSCVAATCTHLLTSVTPNQTYHAAVVAQNAKGSSDMSLEHVKFFTFAPGAVNSFLLTAVSSSSVKATWLAPTDQGGLLMVDYQLSICESANPTACLSSPTVAGTILEKTVTGMTKTINYTFTISGSNGYTGAGTTVIRGPEVRGAIVLEYTPAAPTSVTGTVVAVDSIKVDWTMPDNGGRPVTKYYITCSSTNTSVATQTFTWAPAGSSATTYTVTGLTPRSAALNQTVDTYVFTVQAENDAKDVNAAVINSGNGAGKGPVSSPSAGVPLSGPPGVVRDMVAVVMAPTSLYFEWLPPDTDGGRLITKYDLYISTKAANFANVSAISVTSTNYDFTAASGITYVWKVVAHNSAGAGPSSPVAEKLNEYTSDAPASASAFILNWTSIRVDWTAPGNNGGSNITNYLLYAVASGANVQNQTVSAAALSAEFYNLVQGTTYTFKVFAINGVGVSIDKSVTLQLIFRPSVLRNIVLTNLITSMNISWDGPSDNGGQITDHVKLLWTVENSTTTQTISCSTGCGPASVLLTGLTSGKTVQVNLTVHNSVGYSDVVSVSQKLVYPPRAPANVTSAVLSSTGASVSWADPADVGGEPITAYTISWVSDGVPGGAGPDSGSTVVTAPATSKNITSLQMGDTYTFTVSANNSVGRGPESADTEATLVSKPDAPTSLVLAVLSSTSINVTWAGPANNGGKDVTYLVEVRPSGSLTVVKTASVTPANQFPSNTATGNTATITGLTASLVTYTVDVTATNSLGSSVATNTILLVYPPSAPTISSATPNSSTVMDIQFKDPTDKGGADIDLFKLEYKLKTAGSYTPVTFANPNVAERVNNKPLLVTGLIANSATAYEFRIAAHNPNSTLNAGWGPFSATFERILTFLPGPPRSLAAVVISATQITVTWQAPADTGGLTIDSYEFQVLDNSNNVLASAGAVLGGTVLTQTATLAKEQNYTFQIRANNSYSSTQWGPFASVGPILLESFPDSPAITFSQTVSASQQELTVKIVNTGGRDIKNYTVRYRENGTATAFTTFSVAYNSVQGLTNQKIVVSSLTSGKTYEFQVAAANDLGISPFSASKVDSVNFLATAPSISTITAVSLTTVTVQWSRPADDGGLAITGYVLSHNDLTTSGTAIATYHNASTFGSFNGSAPSQSLNYTTLILGHTYEFSVKAENSLGLIYSNTSTTSTFTFYFSPSAPAVDSVVIVSASSMTLNLTAPVNNGARNVTKYTVTVYKGDTATDAAPATSTIDFSVTYNQSPHNLAVSSLASGKFYKFSAVAVNSEGASPMSDTSTYKQLLFTPNPPVPGSVATLSETTMRVTWAPPSETGGSAILSYLVEAYTVDANKTVATFLQNQTVTHNATAGNSQNTVFTFTASELTKTIVFRQRANNAQGNSAFNIDSAALPAASSTTLHYTPLAVQAFAASRYSVDEVRLSWTAPASNGGLPLDVYTIQYGVSGLAATTVTSATVSAQLTGLTPGSTYYFRVAATNSLGLGPYTPDATVVMTDTPKATTIYPTSQVYPPICDSATLSTKCLVRRDEANPGRFVLFVEWVVLTNVIDRGGLPVTKYKVEYSESTTFNVANAPIVSQEVSTGSATTLLATNMTNVTGGSVLYVRVTGYNSDGYGTPSSLSFAILIGVEPQPPNVHSDNITSLSSTEILFNISAGTDTGGLPIKGFFVSLKYTKTITTIQCQQLTASSFAQVRCGNLTADVDWRYISLVTVKNTKDLTSKAAGPFFHALTFSPSVPASVVLSIPTSTSIQVNWTTSSDLGGYALVNTSYEIEIWNQNSTGAKLNVSSDTLTGGVNNKLFTGLNQDAEYYFHVRAVNGFGPSAYTAATRITLNFPPSKPLSVVSNMLTSTSAQLNWTQPTDLGGSKVVDYQVVVNDITRNTTSTLTVGSNATSLQLTGLNRGSELSITVAAQTTFTKFAGSPIPLFGDKSDAHDLDVWFQPSEPRNPRTQCADFSPDCTVFWDLPADLGGLPFGSFDISLTQDNSTVTLISNITTDRNLTVENGGSSFNYVVRNLQKGATYSIKIRSVNQIGAGPYSTNISQLVSYCPSPPLNVTAVVVGTLPVLSLSVSWSVPVDDGGSAISNYLIHPARDKTADGTALSQVPGNTLTTTFLNITVDKMLALFSDSVKSNLVVGDYYSISVTAQNAGLKISRTDSVVQTLLALVPTAPTVSAVTLDSKTIKISVTPPASSGGSTLLQYKIFWVTGSSAEQYQNYSIVTGNEAKGFNFTLGNLTAAANYRIQVLSVNAKGDGARSAPLNITMEHTPTAVQNVTLTPRNISYYEVAWVVPADDGGRAVSQYEISYRTSTGNTSAFNVSGAQTLHNLQSNGLTLGEIYFVKVRAFNVMGAGPSSAEVSGLWAAVPFNPNLTATVVGPDSVYVNWTVPSANGVSISGYTLSWTGATTGTANPTSASFTATNLTGGGSYTFSVYATNSLGNSASDSKTVTLLFKPDPPVSVNGRTATFDNLTVSWQDGPLGGGSVVRYDLYVSNDNFSTTLTSKNTTNKFYVFKDAEKLPLNMTYYFRVTVTTSLGTSDFSAQGPLADYFYQFSPVSPVLVLTAAKFFAKTASTAYLTWSVPALAGLSVQQYKVYYDTSSSFLNPNSTVVPSSTIGSETSTEVTGLVPGATYYFKVSAVNFLGEGNASSPSGGLQMVTKPDDPTSFNVTVTGFFTVDLKWLVPFNGASPLTQYTLILYEANSTTAIRVLNVPANAGPNSTGSTFGYTPTSLFTAANQGLDYYFVLTAENTAPVGSQTSGDVTSNTFKLVYAPDVPQAVTATLEALNSVKVVWAAPANFGGYNSSVIVYSLAWDVSSFVNGTSNSPRNVVVSEQAVTEFVVNFNDTVIGDTVTFFVVASNPTGASEAAAETVALLYKPFPPTTVYLPEVVSAREVKVKWNPDTRGPTLTGAKVIVLYNNTDYFTDEVTGGEAVILFDEADQGKTFQFAVASKNAYGFSAWTSATPPSGVPLIWRPETFPAGSLRFSHPTLNNLEVSFDKIADSGGLDIVKYVLYYSLSPNVGPTDLTTKTEFVNPAGNQTVINPNLPNFTVSISNLTSWGTYYFRIGSVNNHPLTDFRESILSPNMTYDFVWNPADVSNFTANTFAVDFSKLGQEATVLLAWNAPDSRGRPIDLYQVTYSSPNSTAVTQNIAAPTPSAPVPTFVHIPGLVLGASYTFSVRAHNGVGYSEAATTSSLAVLWNPDQVTGVKLSISTSTSVKVEWSAPKNGFSAISLYEIIWSTVNDQAYLAGNTNTTQTYVIVDKLIPRTTYYFWVRARNSIGAGQFSAAGSIQLFAQPNAPTNVEAFLNGRSDENNDRITIFWHKPTDDGGQTVVSYRIWYSNSSNASALLAGPDFNITTARSLNTPDATISFTIINPSVEFGGQTLIFKVAAINGVADPTNSKDYGDVSTFGPASGITLKFTPSQPGVVSLFPDAKESVKAAWSPPTFDGYDGLSWYTLRWYLANSTVAAGSKILNSTATTSTVGGLTPGQVYEFTISASNPTGEGFARKFASNVKVLTTPSETNITYASVIGSDSVNITWLPPVSDGFSPITRYSIYFTSTVANLQLSKLNVSTTASSREVIVPGLTPGTQYYFLVTAHNALGEGVLSDPSSIYLPKYGTPTEPRAFAVRINGQGANATAELSWVVPLDRAGHDFLDLTGYNLCYAYSNYSDVCATTTALNYTLTVPSGFTVTFKVQAMNSVGPGANAQVAIAVKVKPDGVSGDVQRSLVPGKRDSVLLTWAAPNNGGSQIFQYTLMSSTDSNFSTSTSTYSIPTTGDGAFSLSGLTLGTQYFYKIRSTNSEGDSTFGATQNFTLFLPPAAVPGVTVSTADVFTSAVVTYSKVEAVPANGGKNVTGYVIYYAATENPIFDWAQRATLRNVTNDAAAQATKTITGLTPGSTYYFMVTAQNSEGEGEWQSDRDILKQKLYVSKYKAPEVCNDVSVSTEGEGATGNVTVSWKPPVNLAGFDVLAVLNYTVCFDSVCATSSATTFKTSSVNFIGKVVNVTVFASNVVGEGLRTTVPKLIAVRPETPTNVYAAAVGAEHVFVNWTAGLDGGSNRTKFVILVFKGATVFKTVDVGAKKSETVVVLPGGEQYGFKVQAFTDCCESYTSSSSEFVHVQKQGQDKSTNQKQSAEITETKIKVPPEWSNKEDAMRSEFFTEVAALMGVGVHRVIYLFNTQTLSRQKLRKLLAEEKVYVWKWGVVSDSEVLSSAKTPEEAMAVYLSELKLFLDPATKSASKFSQGKVLALVDPSTPTTASTRVIDTQRCSDGSYVPQGRLADCPKDATPAPAEADHTIAIAVGVTAGVLLILVVVLLVLYIKKRKTGTAAFINVNQLMKGGDLDKDVEMPALKNHQKGSYGSADDTQLEMEVEEY